MTLKNAEKPRVYGQQIRFLHKNVYIGIPAAIINIAVLSVVLWNITSRNALFIWIAINVTLLITAFFYVRYFFSRKVPDTDMARWGRFIKTGLFFSGAAFGSAGVFLFSEDAITYQVFLAFVLGGMLAGAVGILSATMSAFLAYSIPLFIPIIVHFFVRRQGVQIPMGLLCLVFWIVMFEASRLVRKTAVTSIALRFEKEDLVEKLEAEVEERKTADIGLRESEQRFQTLSSSAFEGIVIHRKGIILDFNNASQEMFGYGSDEVTGKSIFEFIERRFHESIRHNINNGNENTYEAKGVKRDGTIFPIEIQARSMVFKGKPAGVAAIRDISERKTLEMELKESKERLDLAIHGAGLGLWDWNISTGDVYINQRWAEMLGYIQSEIEPNVTTWQKLIHPDDFSMVMEALNEHLEGKTAFYETEHRLRTKSGEWKWVLDSGRVVEWDADGKAIRASGFHRDINEKKELEYVLVKMSMIDGLTGLANRRHFDEIFEREWRRGLREQSSLSVVMIDIDYFKKYNDRYGHQAGDDCLRTVGQCLADTIKRPGDFIARYGGEEFVVILPSTELDSALSIAESMRGNISDLKLSHGDSLVAPVVTISAGVASAVPAKDGFSDRLIKMADDALYKAKDSGRNRVICLQ